ncbi:MAG TPA: lipopolysaccharide kinase InaA family protein [Planctomycetaceae bacterium]|nr:lipopolysaccharide kinase InaA family protein [Planctomycetaceae bacterium]
MRIGHVTWRGDEQIVQDLYECGFASVCGREGAEAITTQNALLDRVTTIKSGPHRSVFRLDLPTGVVFLKHFKVSRWWEAVRDTLRGTQAAREARAARIVAAAGIETITCAAIGAESRGPLVRDSYLVSHAIADVTPLDELIRNPAHAGLHTPAFRRELARALGQLCGRLHRAGLVHRDLHPANLLAEVKADGRIRLTLIDLQGVRTRRAWGLVFRRGARARWDLFGLFNFFQSALRSDRCRFLNAYLSEAGPAAAGAGWIAGIGDASRGHHRFRLRLAHRIEAFCRSAVRREQLRYDKKWQRSNRRLIVADSGGVRCRGLAVLGTDQVLELRANPDSLFRPDRVRFWLRRSTFERTAVVDLWAAGTALRCEATETSRPLGWRDLVPRLRWSSTRRAWEMGHALQRRGVSTPRMLFYLETRDVSRVREILASERPSRSVPVTTFLAHHLPSLSERQKETWIKANSRQLAAELVRMRELSLVHRQISACDVLVGIDPAEARVQIGGADCIEKRRFVSRRRTNRVLIQLQASLAPSKDLRRTHRLRFLQKYLGSRFAADWKSTWRTIATQQPAVAATRDLRPIGQSPARRTARAASVLLALTLAFCGCQAVDRPITLPVKHQVKCEQLLVLSDFKLQKDHELIRELSTLREQEARELELPLQRDPVVVYLFNNEAEYRKYMAVTYPKLPPRSAYFVGSSTELAVYTHWGQSVREDLRHEYTHGLLHSAMKRVPLWLDEGLAEYFEISGPQPGGINREYASKLSSLLAQGWKPNLKRLEGLGDDAQMRRSDYQEAWAWVHFMLHGSPEAKHVLLSYLTDLRTNPNPKSISRRLAAECPDFQERSMSYMSRLAPEKQLVEAL